MIINISQCGQMIINISKCGQMLINMFQCGQMIINISQCVQMLRNNSQFGQMWANAGEEGRRRNLLLRGEWNTWIERTFCGGVSARPRRVTDSRVAMKSRVCHPERTSLQPAYAAQPFEACARVVVVARRRQLFFFIWKTLHPTRNTFSITSSGTLQAWANWGEGTNKIQWRIDRKENGKGRKLRKFPP